MKRERYKLKTKSESLRRECERIRRALCNHQRSCTFPHKCLYIQRLSFASLMSKRVYYFFSRFFSLSFSFNHILFDTLLLLMLLLQWQRCTILVVSIWFFLFHEYEYIVINHRMHSKSFSFTMLNHLKDN